MGFFSSASALQALVKLRSRVRRSLLTLARLCGLRRARPTAPVRTIFDTWAADGRADTMERAHGPVTRRVLERARLASDGWFLDIGCGNGYAVRWASTMVPDGCAVGIDAAPRMIEKARDLSEDLANVRFHTAEFPRHDLPLGRFDVVFSMEALYYMDPLGAALAEILRLLKPGGHLLSALDFFRENADSHGWPGYVRTKMELKGSDEWRRALNDAGFESVTTERIRIPEGEAVEPWHATVGSLLLTGRRPS